MAYSLGLFAARTGRHDERSAQLAAGITAANAARTVATGFDQFPRRHGGRSGVGFGFLYRIVCFDDVHQAPQLGSGSTSTSHPLEVGIPVPSVVCPMSRQVGGP